MEWVEGYTIVVALVFLTLVVSVGFWMLFGGGKANTFSITHAGNVPGDQDGVDKKDFSHGVRLTKENGEELVHWLFSTMKAADRQEPFDKPYYCRDGDRIEWVWARHNYTATPIISKTDSGEFWVGSYYRSEETGDIIGVEIFCAAKLIGARNERT